MTRAISKDDIIDRAPDIDTLHGYSYHKVARSICDRVESIAEWWIPNRFTAMLPTIIEGDTGDAGIVDIVTHDDDAGSAGDAASPVEFLEDREEEGVRH